MREKEHTVLKPQLHRIENLQIFFVVKIRLEEITSCKLYWL